MDIFKINDLYLNIFQYVVCLTETMKPRLCNRSNNISQHDYNYSKIMLMLPHNYNKFCMKTFVTLKTYLDTSSSRKILLMQDITACFISRGTVVVCILNNKCLSPQYKEKQSMALWCASIV
jgi:hypothetical protein